MATGQDYRVLEAELPRLDDSAIDQLQGISSGFDENISTMIVYLGDFMVREGEQYVHKGGYVVMRKARVAALLDEMRERMRERSASRAARADAHAYFDAEEDALMAERRR